MDDTLVVVVASLLTWAGATLTIDGWLRSRSRPSLTERLAPFQPESVADEAQRWLDRQA
jgi:hypothetical protein